MERHPCRVGNGVLIVVQAKFRLPPGWFSRTIAEDSPRLIADSLDLDERGLAALRESVSRVGQFLDGLGGERDTWLLPEPSGAVDAVLSLRGFAGSPGDREMLLRSLSDIAVDPAVEVINRTTRETLLPAGESVETHDFSVAHGHETGARPASERATVTIFSPSGEWVVEFLMVTQDLLLFDDALGYLHAVAETVEPFLDVTR
jgi:hypothetical protein